ncbi:MAG TPA: NADH-quinone oxidoreductase subunit L [Euzebyales bacterium]|nr:NADH-quinone oxidoreductase subunit L [Euzebyales bacterium]
MLTTLLAAAEGGFAGHYADAAAGSPVALAWLIPVLPAVSAALLLVFGRRIGRASAAIAIAAVAVSALLSTWVFTYLRAQPEDARSFVTTVAPWLSIGDFQVDWALLVDPLAAVMLLLVTWVGLLIHIYSLGYMEGDEGFPRFFAYLNLFVASMLVLVLGESMLVLFVGWELVGLCSYLLIGFWFTERGNATAAKKAFVVNRIGDVGFMIAMFLTYSAVGSLSFTEVLPHAGDIAAGAAVAIGVLLLVGATGKSAQIPLFVWLPDAMAGPTPVSALIHAATMVTAGVYLIARMSPLYAAIHDAALFDVGLLVAWVGVLTALLAALIACAQNDLKRILAYSTVSQLGYMFVGVGLGSQAAGVFHLLTHGAFKALLFLAAGSVMHALHEETDVWKMGGLRKAMPITFATSAVAWLAISGMPFFAGFYSKEEVLIAALDTPGAGPIWVLGVIVAGLTAFYMSRWFFLIFLGGSRVAEGVHPHESPRSMTLPLVALAVPSLLGGLIGVTPLSYLRFWAPEHGWLFEWLAPAVQPYVGETPLFDHVLAGLLVLAVSLAGIGAAYLLYLRPADIVAVRARLGWLYQAMLSKFWVDELYERTVATPGYLMAEGMATFDTRGIDGTVNGLGRGTHALAQLGRRVQTGFVRSYALAVLLGTLLISVLFLGGTMLGR